ncbi:CBS domain-containing protein [Sphingomonas changnyeongensis]|uniref:CBS domain-containing protein n=2 Tax=Sphingomonas changnyeongensis TaxID=2698679 RepID=A0A7Z2NVV0_9SPHN|nr:CBS domain-containing protein [Sphingomonas changnyeongensis]
MTKNLLTVGPAVSIAEAARLMAIEDVGALPVVDRGMLIGVVTDRDLVVRALANRLPGSTAISQVMTSSPVTCDDDASLDDVLETMSDEQIRRLPVVSDGGGLVGIVSIADIAGVKGAARDVGETVGGICRARGQHCQSEAMDAAH